ncbi:hypothetical protein IMSAG013_00105 [Clostridiales bacterium]|nr:hypothetical protein IMSAG013_00105 [Clostridiales bacterium]
MSRFNNVIETQYRKLTGKISNEYIFLYNDFSSEKLKSVFSTLHANLIYLFEKMNLRLPTKDDGNYYWADESRGLIQTIEIIFELYKSLSGSPFEFEINPYYKDLFDKCNGFLQQYGGSTIPPHMEKVELYYTIPIFISVNKDISVEAPKIEKIDREYIKSITERALDDIEKSNYDSCITKCRTLVEEVFCYVIELKNEQPTESGDITALYNQVKSLYNMHQARDIDVRINMLLSGLEKILTAIVQMRNKDSDSHGVGSRRINIEEHHSRLFVNSAIAISDFILSVAERNISQAN